MAYLPTIEPFTELQEIVNVIKELAELEEKYNYSLYEILYAGMVRGLITDAEFIRYGFTSWCMIHQFNIACAAALIWERQWKTDLPEWMQTAVEMAESRERERKGKETNGTTEIAN